MVVIARWSSSGDRFESYLFHFKQEADDYITEKNEKIAIIIDE